jgi:hypothetical protein
MNPKKSESVKVGYFLILCCKVLMLIEAKKSRTLFSIESWWQSFGQECMMVLGIYSPITQPLSLP